MVVASSANQFIIAQRQRLDILRQATERERSLLASSQSVPQESSSTTFVASSTPAALPDFVLRHIPTASQAAAKVAQDVREEELRRLMTSLAKEEDELREEEAKVDRRLAAAEDAKRELLSTMIALQYREAELKDRSDMLDEEEAAARQHVDDAKQRIREINHQRELLEHDQVERQSKLSLSQKKVADRQAEQSKVIQRLKQQLNEQEDRVRSLEMQYMSRVRAVDDLEREVHRQTQLQRDAELAAIEDLRADIQRTRAAHGWS